MFNAVAKVMISSDSTKLFIKNVTENTKLLLPPELLLPYFSGHK